MLPIGYMYKVVRDPPKDLKNDKVERVYSVSACINDDFGDWVQYWKHNGFWFFDDPEIIQKIAKDNNIDLSEMKLFFYKAYDLQWNDVDERWESFSPEPSFKTDVVLPNRSDFEGFDLVTFYARTSAEHSPLSCNYLAQEVEVNENCLLDSFERAKILLESGRFSRCEPGPYRIFEVYSVEDA